MAAVQSGALLIPDISAPCLCFLLKVGATEHIVDSIFQYTIHMQRQVKDE